MTNSPQFTGHPPIAALGNPRRLKPWHVIALLGLALVTLCFVGTALFAGAGGTEPKPKTPQVAPIVTGTAPAASYVVPAQPVTVKGKGNTVVPVKATLNGAFNVEYSFGSWCGIVEFVKADGSEGAGAMETVNDCSGSTSEKLKGSTIVHLKSVTQVKVQNTTGAWTLTFTPIG